MFLALNRRYSHSPRRRQAGYFHNTKMNFQESCSQACSTTRRCHSFPWRMFRFKSFTRRLSTVLVRFTWSMRTIISFINVGDVFNVVKLITILLSSLLLFSIICVTHCTLLILISVFIYIICFQSTLSLSLSLYIYIYIYLIQASMKLFKESGIVS